MKNSEFKIKFNSNPYKKGEILTRNWSELDVCKVVKVYDHIWWRKILIKLKWMKPSFTIKVTTIW